MFFQVGTAHLITRQGRISMGFAACARIVVQQI
jgi:hypothetical protein